MIRGLDINAFYQQYPWKKINWRELKDDPLDFRFIWIKCSEGTDAVSYVEGAAECVVGARSVGFEAINPYHYYLHQYADWSSGAAVWRVISAKDQAQAFYDSAKAAGFAAGHPMMDWEDPLIDQFLQWSDTDSINKAIAFARKLNAHLQAYTYAIRDLFGVLPDAYTGKWWLDKFIPLLIGNGYAAETLWLKDLYYILADYDGTLNIPDYIPADHVIAWQETSSPVPPVMGIPTGRVVPGDALDIDRWMLSEEQFLLWSGQKENETMAGTYKTNVPQADRGRFVILSDEDKKVDVAAVCAGVDGLGLAMVSQQVSGMLVKKDGAFQIYAGRATVPAAAIVVMDQDLFWKKEIDLNKFQDSSARNMWNNETLRAMLEQWRSNPIPEAEWNAKKLNISAGDGGWLPISAIWLHMATMINPVHNAQIGGAWQMAIVDDLLKPLTTLMQGGYIPKVPIYVMASGDWYKKYAGDTGWKIGDRIGNGQVAGCGVLRVWGREENGLVTELAPMVTPLDSVRQLWTYVPSESYSYPVTMNGSNFQFFVFSYNRLRATDMFYSGSEITPATCGTWCDTQEAMHKALNWTGEVTPGGGGGETETPPVDLTAVLARLDAVDAAAEANRRIIMQELLSLRAKVDGIFK